MQISFGASPPTLGVQPANVSPEAIDDQCELLEAHRRTLAIYLKQQATLGVIITGLVGAYKAYTDYKAAIAKETAPMKSAEAAKGEQAAPLVKAAVQQYGDAKDQRALTNFEDDPELYEGALRTMLTRLADRSPAFAQQLQTLAQQANIQTGGVHGEVKVSDHGKIVGGAFGVSTGEVRINVRDDDEDA